MKILIACEFSGIVREAFHAKGHDAWSCDLLPTEIPGNHIEGDVLSILDQGWELMIAHPPCTFLTTSANKWHLPQFKSKYPNREDDRNRAVKFFMQLWHAPIEKICIENPKGIMTSRFRKANQYIQPCWYGHDTNKITGLWLKNLPRLNGTDIRKPEYIIARSGTKHSPFHYHTYTLPLKERAKVRSRTYQGIANAMAAQWG